MKTIKTLLVVILCISFVIPSGATSICLSPQSQYEEKDPFAKYIRDDGEIHQFENDFELYQYLAELIFKEPLSILEVGGHHNIEPFGAIKDKIATYTVIDFYHPLIYGKHTVEKFYKVIDIVDTHIEPDHLGNLEKAINEETFTLDSIKKILEPNINKKRLFEDFFDENNQLKNEIFQALIFNNSLYYLISSESFSCITNQIYKFHLVEKLFDITDFINRRTLMIIVLLNLCLIFALDIINNYVFNMSEFILFLFKFTIISLLDFLFLLFLSLDRLLHHFIKFIYIFRSKDTNKFKSFTQTIVDRLIQISDDKLDDSGYLVFRLADSMHNDVDYYAPFLLKALEELNYDIQIVPLEKKDNKQYSDVVIIAKKPEDCSDIIQLAA